MNIAEFNDLYDDEYRCKVSYCDWSGDKAKGVILGVVPKEKGKRPRVFIDSFTQKIPLSRVITLTKTKTKW